MSDPNGWTHQGGSLYSISVPVPQAPTTPRKGTQYTQGTPLVRMWCGAWYVGDRGCRLAERWHWDGHAGFMRSHDRSIPLKAFRGFKKFVGYPKHEMSFTARYVVDTEALEFVEDRPTNVTKVAEPLECSPYSAKVLNDGLSSDLETTYSSFRLECGRDLIRPHIPTTEKPTMSTLTRLTTLNDWTIARETLNGRPVLVAFNSAGQTIRANTKLVLDSVAFIYDNGKLFSGKVKHTPSEPEIAAEAKKKGEAARAKKIAALRAKRTAIYDARDNEIRSVSAEIDAL